MGVMVPGMLAFARSRMYAFNQPIETLIRRNLSRAHLFIQAAERSRREPAAAPAVENAREAYDRVSELVRSLPHTDQERWLLQLLALQAAIEGVDPA